MNVWGKMKKVTLGGMFVGAMMLMSSISVTGCLTDDKDDDTTKVDTAKHTAYGAEATLNAGAQAHPTVGSVLELDAGKVLLSAAANADQANIDLVVLYYAGAMHLENASMARASGIANSINLTNTYDAAKVKDLKMVKVTTKPADQEAAKKAFTDGTKISGSVIAGGEIFIMETTGGKIALVTVSNVSGVATGTADFKFTVLTI